MLSRRVCEYEPKASQATRIQDTGNLSKRHRLRQAECRPHIDKHITHRAHATHTRCVQKITGIFLFRGFGESYCQTNFFIMLVYMPLKYDKIFTVFIAYFVCGIR